MSKPISPSQILEELLSSDHQEGIRDSIEIEAEVKWFPRPTAEDPNAIESGEAQATISMDGRRYAISLEPLP